MAVPSEISSSWSIAQSWGHRDEMPARFGADVCGQWGELHHTARPLRVSDPDGAVPERPRSPYAAACALPVLPWRGRSAACHPISSEHARTHRIGAVACDGRHNMTLPPGPPPPGRYLPSSWPGCDITVWQLDAALEPGTGRRPPTYQQRITPTPVSGVLRCASCIRNQASILAFVVTLAWARLARTRVASLPLNHRHAEGATTEMRLDGSRHHYHPRPTCVYLPRFPIW